MFVNGGVIFIIGGSSFVNGRASSVNGVSKFMYWNKLPVNRLERYRYGD